MIGRSIGAVAALTGVIVATGSDAASAQDQGRIKIGVGYYDILQQDEEAAAFNLEWRPGVRYFGFLSPHVGGIVATNGAAYGYAGFGAEWVIDDQFVILPFADVGLYAEGDGVDLGHVVEFRTGLELAYRFEDGSEIGISGMHLSNADLDDTNPGTEIVLVHYAVPTARFMD
ncbi:MAG: acyloxyacyl hydrolase [Inquilinaceae bacterium]